MTFPGGGGGGASSAPGPPVFSTRSPRARGAGPGPAVRAGPGGRAGGEGCTIGPITISQCVDRCSRGENVALEGFSGPQPREPPNGLYVPYFLCAPS